MYLAPGEGLYGYVKVICPCTRNLQHRRGGKSRPGVTVVLHLDVWVLLLDSFYKFSKHIWTADTSHVLEADFIGPILHNLVHDVHIIRHGVDGGVGDGKRHLGNHAALFGTNHGALEVAVVIEAAEAARYVRALLLLHLEHKFPYIQRHGVHPERIQAALQHMGLNPSLVERRSPCTHSLVWVLSKEEVHLLKRAAVCFHTVKAAHINDCRSHLHQLIHTRNILS